MANNITPELCEALCKLTDNEWKAVKNVVDSDIRRQREEQYQAFKKQSGPIRCSLTGPELENQVLRSVIWYEEYDKTHT